MRNVAKAIRENEEKFTKKSGRGGCIYVSDIAQVHNIWEESADTSDFNLIVTAMRAGFMIGYRRGRKEARKARKESKKK